jgi:hypothetical protein
VPIRATAALADTPAAVAATLAAVRRMPQPRILPAVIPEAADTPEAACLTWRRRTSLAATQAVAHLISRHAHISPAIRAAAHERILPVRGRRGAPAMFIFRMPAVAGRSRDTLRLLQPIADGTHRLGG